MTASKSRTAVKSKMFFSRRTLTVRTCISWIGVGRSRAGERNIQEGVQCAALPVGLPAHMIVDGL
jgi:hypothetical protein